jgi:tetratricopeptide (TPR) repeat protein
MGELELGLNDLLNGLQITQENPNLLVNTAIALFHLELYGDAIVLLNQALTIDPTFQDALLHRSRVYAFIGKKQMALDDLTKAYKNNESALVLLDFALYHISKHEYTLAEQYLKKASIKIKKAEGDPFAYDSSIRITETAIKIKILENTNPNSSEIFELKNNLKKIIPGKFTKGFLIPGFGEFVKIDLEEEQHPT